ncbi:hypothetical protein DPMN_140235 [Dreissena polymorpha]|uniref:Uncharacterized protein n=1 Tax=Dreissena polymorpha TaxID=45954 RepID=A0A9D4JH84_DREPO|nr:hypothetical protein DPMN_140235 [Dreissena polymorpha]
MKRPENGARVYPLLGSGKSDWTQAIHVTTLLDTVGSGLSTSALGGAVGGVFGVVVVIAVSVLIWRYRSDCGMKIWSENRATTTPLQQMEVMKL